MQVPAKEIAQLLGGELDGNPDVLIEMPTKIEEGRKGTITFLANPKYESWLYKTKASAVIVDRDFKPRQAVEPTLIRVSDVYTSFGQLLNHFNHSEVLVDGVSDKADVDPTAIIGEGVHIASHAVISAGVQLGDKCRIYPQVFIGSNVRIGQNSIIYPGVKIYHDCEIGDNCVIHANTVIGSDGFGFNKQEQAFMKIPQIGNVVLEDNVEIGANTVIDRATLGSTLIGQGSKLDNLIQIAHNVYIGKNTGIAAQAGIAGSSRIGDNVLIGGQVGIAGHLHIASGTQIQAKSGVASSVREENARLYGYPALEYGHYLKSYALFKQLPELTNRIRELERKLEEQANNKKKEDQ